MGGFNAGAGPPRWGARSCPTQLTGSGPYSGHLCFPALRVPPPTPTGISAAPKDHAASDPGKAEYSGAVHPGAQVDGPGDEHQVPPLAQSCALRQSAPRSTVRKPAPIPAGSRFYSWGTHQNEQPHREVRGGRRCGLGGAGTPPPWHPQSLHCCSFLRVHFPIWTVSDLNPGTGSTLPCFQSL